MVCWSKYYFLILETYFSCIGLEDHFLMSHKNLNVFFGKSGNFRLSRRRCQISDCDFDVLLCLEIYSPVYSPVHKRKVNYMCYIVDVIEHLIRKLATPI